MRRRSRWRRSWRFRSVWLEAGRPLSARWHWKLRRGRGGSKKDLLTVSLTREGCTVTPGKPEGDADCFFKASKQMFLDVWNGKYTPSAKDFMLGTIKSNNPLLLKDFFAAFGR